MNRRSELDTHEAFASVIDRAPSLGEKTGGHAGAGGPPLTSGLARSDPVAEHLHAGGPARVALALLVGRELVDVHLAPRPRLLVGNMSGLLRRKGRIGAD